MDSLRCWIHHSKVLRSIVQAASKGACYLISTKAKTFGANLRSIASSNLLLLYDSLVSRIALTLACVHRATYAEAGVVVEVIEFR